MEVLFPEKTSSWVKRILEVLTPEKRALSAGERSSAHAGPILPFFIFIFPGIVLPFCYFSVVRKVMENPFCFYPTPKTWPKIDSCCKSHFPWFNCNATIHNFKPFLRTQSRRRCVILMIILRLNNWVELINSCGIIERELVDLFTKFTTIS